jgi:very-short-patch-repair endonuclease
MYHHAVLLGVSRSISEAKIASENSHDVCRVLQNEDTLRYLYEVEKWSTFEIAEYCHRNRDAVVRALHRHGIHVRRSAPVTWSHELLMRKLKTIGIKIEESQINHQAFGTRYMLDIAFPEIMLAVEVDGRSHFEDADGYYGDRIQYDIDRDNKLISLGWTVKHYTDLDIRYTLSDVVNELRILIQEREASKLLDDEIVRHSLEMRRTQDKEPEVLN